jgi:putative two-component system response regulator
MHDAALSLAATAGRSSGVQIHTDAGLFCSRESPQVVVMPLLCMGKVAGVLLAGGKAGEDAAVSSYDTQLIEAAGSFTNAFADNVALYEEQRDLFIGTVRSLTAAIDAKDRYTFGHSERVSFLATDLARLLGLSESEIETTRIAGLIHDVGKIGVPDGVLKKPGRFTPDERAEMNKHPGIGAEILGRSRIPLFQLAAEVALTHHERWDGGGYPAGTAGDAIPLSGRIVAVVDFFDALTMDRCYRPALSDEVALQMLAEQSGAAFDPHVVEVFLAHVDEMIAVRDAVTRRGLGFGDLSVDLGL